MRLLVGPRKDECVPLEDPAVVKGLLTPILDFLRSKKCYDFLPDSTQVVVLDLDLPLMHTFSVAHEHNVTFATLWDRRTSKYCGMMTVTDYINMLLQYHRDPAGLQARERALCDHLQIENHADLRQDADRKNHHTGGRTLGHDREREEQDSGQDFFSCFFLGEWKAWTGVDKLDSRIPEEGSKCPRISARPSPA